MACHFIHRKLTENTAECQGQPKSTYTTLCADAYHLPLVQLLSTDGERALLRWKVNFPREERIGKLGLLGGHRTKLGGRDSTSGR